MTPVVNSNVCGYCCELMLCEETLRQCIEIGNSSVMH